MTEAEPYAQRAITPWLFTGTYLFVALVIVIFWLERDLTDLEVVAFVGILLIYLARMLSVRYEIRGGELRALRLFGSRRVRLSSIHKARPASLRDLAAVSWTYGWGWRSRMWSPVVGPFDNLSTFHIGLLVYGDGVPLLISPLDRDTFLRELDRRCGNRLLSKST